MQIKHFEAEDMTEALRMVKREFGDDAVILSAKETRPGGIFSAFRKKCVEITAATDYPINDDGEENDFSKQLSEQMDAESDNDRVSLSSKASAFVPVTVRPKPSETQDGLQQRVMPAGKPMDQGGTREPIVPRSTVADKTTAVDKPMQHNERDDMTATPFYRQLSQRRIIALVGSHGTGKSTAVAKLARYCCLVEKKTVALVSLDRFRIGANSTLDKVSKIMDLSFIVARDIDQLRVALDDQADADVILIDTPGMGKADTRMIEDITRMLESAKPDETHLVVNATARQAVLDDWTNRFQPLGIDHLFFTHMDEYGVDDSILDLINTHQLPSAFYTDGVDMFDHLKETSVEGLERFCASTAPKPQQITDFATKQISTYKGKTDRHDSDDEIHFVANRNSELFHHPDCKSVKRINAENITAFSSIEQAMEEGFKPCRACCNIEMIKKVLPGAFAHRRVSAI